MILLFILTFIRAGFESSRANTRVFIYNTDTVFTSTRNSAFISLFSDLNSFYLSLGKKYYNIQYNYENGIFESYGNIIIDSFTHYSDITVLIHSHNRMLDIFMSKEGSYDTLMAGGKFMGLAYHFDWAQHGIHFQHTLKYGFDTRKPESSFDLSIISGNLSLFILGSFTGEEAVFVSKTSYTRKITNNIELEQDVEYFYNTLRIQPRIGTNSFLIGPFLERDDNEGYTMPGINFSYLTNTNFFSIMLICSSGYKNYKDTFFNTNTYHLDISGNLSFTYNGFTLGISGTAIVERENKSYYIVSTIAKEF